MAVSSTDIKANINAEYVEMESINMKSSTLIWGGIGITVVLIALTLIWYQELTLWINIIFTIFLGLAFVLILMGMLSMWLTLRRYRLP